MFQEKHNLTGFMFWIGKPGSVTPTHYDQQHVFLSQVKGYEAYLRARVRRASACGACTSVARGCAARREDCRKSKSGPFLTQKKPKKKGTALATFFKNSIGTDKVTRGAYF